MEVEWENCGGGGLRQWLSLTDSTLSSYSHRELLSLTHIYNASKLRGEREAKLGRESSD